MCRARSNCTPTSLFYPRPCAVISQTMNAPRPATQNESPFCCWPRQAAQPHAVCDMCRKYLTAQCSMQSKCDFYYTTFHPSSMVKYISNCKFLHKRAFRLNDAWKLHSLCCLTTLVPNFTIWRIANRHWEIWVFLIWRKCMVHIIYWFDSKRHPEVQTIFKAVTFSV